MLHQHLMTVSQACVWEQLTERPLLAGQRIIDRNLLWSMLQAPCDTFQRDIGALRNFLGCRSPAMLHNKGVNNLVDASYIIAAIFWKPHKGLRGAGTVNSLSNPPDGIGAELQIASIVKVVNRPHQPNIAILNQVAEGQASIAKLVDDTNNQTQIVVDHLLFRLFHHTVDTA